jgi:hypothetical protein
MSCQPPSGDRGAGLIGTIAGVTVFLAFLLFAVQLLVNLYTTTTVTGAAHEGVQMVASHEVDHHDSVAVANARAEAEAEVRGLLGEVGDRAELDWSASTPDEVALRVRVSTPRFLLPSLQASLGFDEVDRTVRARVEEVR